MSRVSKKKAAFRRNIKKARSAIDAKIAEKTKKSYIEKYACAGYRSQITATSQRPENCAESEHRIGPTQ